MRELLHGIDDMRLVLRRRMLRAAVAASGKLARAVAGRESFQSDHQLRACVAMLRLAPALVGDLEEKPGTFEGPEWWTPEKVRCWEGLCTDGTRDDFARWWLQAFRLNGPLKDAYTSNAEAMDYGRRRYDERKGRSAEASDDFNARILNEETGHE